MSDPGLEACKIPGNPDIAGIGVRSAVYLQAVLAVLTFAYLLRTYVTEGPVLVERYIQAKVKANSAQDPEEESLEHGSDEQPVNEPESTSPAPEPDSATSPLEENEPNAEQMIEAEAERQQDAQEDSGPRLRRSRTAIVRRHRKLEYDTIVHFTNRGQRIDEDQECLNTSRSLGRSVILIGAAVLVSSFLQAKTRNDGLSHYHTLIILNISWINSWCAVLLGIISKYLAAKNFVLNMYRRSARDGALVQDEAYMFSKMPFFVALALDEIALVIHVYAMCALGLWFWAKPNNDPFAKYATDAEINPGPCRILTYYWVFNSIPQDSRRLRIGSLVAYAFYAFIHLPGYYIQLFGMAVPALAFFIGMLPALVILLFCLAVEAIVFGVHSLVTKGGTRRSGPIFAQCGRLLGCLLQFSGAIRTRERERETREGRHVIYSFVGKLFFPLFLIGVAPFVWFVVATEQLIRANSANVLEGELDWTYGQTLALFSAIVATCSFAGSMWGVMKERRRVQKEQEALDLDEEKGENSQQ